MKMIREYFAMLQREFRGYNGAKLAKDLMAGITVCAVALPLALAFGVSSGATASAGLITAIIAGVFMSVLAGGFYQISGPTGAMAAILAGIVAQYGMQGVFVATFLAGVFLLAAGFLHLGRLTGFIPAPVIAGFTSGIAVIIALGQVDNFFGVHSEGVSAVEKLMSYGRLGFSPNWYALGIGLLVVVLMIVYPKKWNGVVPSSLVAIIAATAISSLFKMDVAVVGAIPKTLLPDERLTLSALDMTTVKAMLAPAVSIAMLGMIESLLCGASAGRMTGITLKSDQELVAQGVGNMLVPLFGGIPATAAIARTSVAIKSGAITRLAGVFHALGLLASMMLLSPLMGRIPLAGLAGVLMVTAWRMNEWGTIRYWFRHRLKSSITKFFVTMLATVLFDLTTAILIGIVVGVVFFVAKSSGLEVSTEDVDPSRMGLEALPGSRDAAVVYLTGPLFFMTADALREGLARVQGKKTVILSMRGVPSIDVTAAGVLEEYYKASCKAGVRVLFSSVQPHVKVYLERTGIVEEVGEECFYQSVDKLLAQLAQG